jgi:hypothetical protein
VTSGGTPGLGGAKGESRDPSGSSIDVKPTAFRSEAEIKSIVNDIQRALGKIGSGEGIVKCNVGPGVVITRVPMKVESRRGGGKRQPIVKWTKSSRLHMERTIASLDLTPLMARRDWGWKISMLTLTYPGDWERLVPGASHAQRHLKMFRQRLARATGQPVLGCGKREWQRRGAVHYHLCLALPMTINGSDVHEWVSQNWYEVVGSNDIRHLRAGTRIDWSTGARATDPYRVALYFLHHSAPSEKSSKSYQHEVPQLWADSGDIGRFWFVWGMHSVDAELNLTTAQYVELRRLLRAHYRSTHDRREVTVERVNTKTGVITKRKTHRRARLWNLESGRLVGATYFNGDAPALLLKILTQRVETEFDVTVRRSVSERSQQWR